MKKLKKLFDEIFKFKVTQRVKHKAQDKNTEDLFIVSRSLSDEGNNVFCKVYNCRLMSSPRAGAIITFDESELISLEDFEKELLRAEHERDVLRIDGKNQINEMFDIFGVKIGDRVTHKIKEGYFKVCGISNLNNELNIRLRPENTINGLIKERIELTVSEFREYQKV